MQLSAWLRVSGQLFGPFWAPHPYPCLLSLHPVDRDTGADTGRRLGPRSWSNLSASQTRWVVVGSTLPGQVWRAAWRTGNGAEVGGGR